MRSASCWPAPELRRIPGRRWRHRPWSPRPTASAVRRRPLGDPVSQQAKRDTATLGAWPRHGAPAPEPAAESAPIIVHRHPPDDPQPSPKAWHRIPPSVLGGRKKRIWEASGQASRRVRDLLGHAGARRSMWSNNGAGASWACGAALCRCAGLGGDRVAGSLVNGKRAAQYRHPCSSNGSVQDWPVRRRTWT